MIKEDLIKLHKNLKFYRLLRTLNKILKIRSEQSYWIKEYESKAKIIAEYPNPPTGNHDFDLIQYLQLRSGITIIIITVAKVRQVNKILNPKKSPGFILFISNSTFQLQLARCFVFISNFTF